MIYNGLGQSHNDDDTDDDVTDDTNGGDGVQQSQVSSSEPGPSILASNVIGPLLLEVCLPLLCIRHGRGSIFHNPAHHFVNPTH